jgi:transcription initiation factor IIE alpha subunit
LHKPILTGAKGKSLLFLPALPLFTREVTGAVEKKKKKLILELRMAYFNNSFYMCYSIGETYMACESNKSKESS